MPSCLPSAFQPFSFGVRSTALWRHSLPGLSSSLGNLHFVLNLLGQFGFNAQVPGIP